MRRFGIVIGILALGAAAALPAQGQEVASPVAPDQPASGQAVSDQAAQQEKKICRTERMTGSLTRVRRTCMTRAQWDRMAEGSRDNYDTITNDANQALNNRGGCIVQGC